MEKWIKQHQKDVSSQSSVLLFVFDNCNFHLNVTKRTSDHKSSYLNLINRFIVEIFETVEITAKTLWNNVDRKTFGEWLSSTNDESLEWMNTNWNLFDSRPANRPLKFLYAAANHICSFLNKSDIIILPLIFDRETLSYVDVRGIVDEFAQIYILPTERVFAFVAGDQQVWIKLFKLRLNFPTEYHWMIPVPGGWHWTWHILKGIYRMYYDTIFLPISQILGFKHLDKNANNFHYTEDFLEVVTIGIYNWIVNCIKKIPGRKPSIADWLHSRKGNRRAYELAYACLHYFIPYWVCRSAIKWNQADKMEEWWRYWIHLFIAAGKNHYSLLSIRFLWILRSVDVEVKELYDKYCTLSFSGDLGTGIPADGVVELVSKSNIMHNMLETT